MNAQSGRLYLVSAGIGDSDNITIRAQKIIEQANVVLAMDFVRKQFADLLAGKEVYDAGHGLFTGMDVNSVTEEGEAKVRNLIRDAFAKGKTIVVMDFGDPTVYGPHSHYLKEFADLDPVVIPGVSSFNAANAVLGREITGAYDRAIILTESMSEWEGARERLASLAATQSTLVFFTMRLDLAQVAGDLMQHYPADTPVAIVCHAGFSEQEKVLYATLETVVELAEKEKLPWDHLIYVGDFLK